MAQPTWLGLEAVSPAGLPHAGKVWKINRMARGQFLAGWPRALWLALQGLGQTGQAGQEQWTAAGHLVRLA